MIAKPVRLTTVLASLAVALLAACEPKNPAPLALAASPVDPDEITGHPDILLPQMTCGAHGFFQKDVTRADLAAAHGEENLAEETAPWVDSVEPALVLFPDDPTMRAELFWLDRTTGGPRFVRVYGDNTQWIGPGGLAMGATLADVEAANGGPFTLVGFQNHNNGELVDWLGGALDSPENADCYNGLSFDILDGIAPDVASRVSGDSETVFRSDSPEMRAANPIVVEFSIGFMQPVN